jgi:hypothetical protein
LGWLDPKFKRNGKKLLASTSVLWKFMVSEAVKQPQQTILSGCLALGTSLRECFNLLCFCHGAPVQRLTVRACGAIQFNVTVC